MAKNSPELVNEAFIYWHIKLFAQQSLSKHLAESWRNALESIRPKQWLS